MRIGLISDTQMYTAEMEQFLPLLKKRPVDFWIHAGDVCLVNQNTAANWTYTKNWLTQLGKPVFCVPGNHDFTYGLDGFWTIDNGALDLWSEYIGPLQFVKETEHTRYIGLNYIDWGEDNQTWISNQLNTPKRKVIISHFPLGVISGFGHWVDVYTEEKCKAFSQADLFIAGHRHHFIVGFVGDGLRQVILPALSFTAGTLPEHLSWGEFPMSYPVLGWMELEDSPSGLRLEFFRQDGLKVWA